jgi:hypothetical protein
VRPIKKILNLAKRKRKEFITTDITMDGYPGGLPLNLRLRKSENNIKDAERDTCSG